MPAQRKDFIPVPGITGHPACSASRPDELIIFVGTAKKKQTLKEDIGTGIKLSLEDSEAVREAADKANVVQGDRYADNHITLLFADTP